MHHTGILVAFLVSGVLLTAIAFVNVSDYGKKYNSVVAWFLGLHTIAESRLTDDVWRTSVRFVSVRYILGLVVLLIVGTLNSTDNQLLVVLSVGFLFYVALVHKKVVSHIDTYQENKS